MEIGPEKEGKGAPPSQLEIQKAETTPQLYDLLSLFATGRLRK